jgi:hypothetical protein
MTITRPQRRAVGQVGARGLLLIVPFFAGLARADQSSTPDVVVMEKMIVEATETDTSPGILGGLFRPRKAWLYVAVPDYEILSQCDTEQTDAVARHIAEALRSNRQLIPEPFLVPLATPMSFIIFDHTPSPAMEALVPGANQWVPKSNDFGSYFGGGPSVFIGGSATWDPDTHCVVQNRSGGSWPYAGGDMTTGPIPTGTLFELSRCTPALPLWYLYGFDGPCGIERGMGPVWATAKWISPEDADRVLAAAHKAHTLPVLPPIQSLFERHGDPDGRLPKTPPSAEWSAEAALFVRWGLIGEPEKYNPHGQAFADFVLRSRVERVTEPVFRECFGFGYAAMQQILSRYFLDAVKEPIVRERYDHPADRPEVRQYRPEDGPPKVISRTATPVEVARLLGDWERMRGDDLVTTDPALSRVFLRQAGRTLHRAYDRGERDPRLLAALGLFDFEVGDVVEARNVLTSAVNAGVARPAAYLDLAQLEFNEATAHPAGAGGTLSPEQTAAVLKPIFTARHMARLDAAGYALIAEAWEKCVSKPKADNLAVLVEGTLMYPFDTALCAAAAQTYARWGYTAGAEALFHHGLQVANGEISTEKIQLRSSQQPAPPSGAN